jgi:parallel beta-helix repeat protein
MKKQGDFHRKNKTYNTLLILFLLLLITAILVFTIQIKNTLTIGKVIGTDGNIIKNIAFLGKDIQAFDESNPINISNCTNITVAGYYTLNTSISGINGDCFEIKVDNVTLDFKGYSITGNGNGSGVFSDGRDDLVVKNSYIYNFYRGIYFFSGPDRAIIINNTIKNQTYAGIGIVGSENSTVIDNTIENASYAVYFNTDTRSIVKNNRVLNSEKGVYISNYYGGGSSIAYNNTIINMTHAGVYVEGNSTNVTGNTIYGFNSSSEGIYLEYVYDTIIEENNLSNGDVGIYLKGSINSTLSINNITNFSNGIELYYNSLNNLVELNTLKNNKDSVYIYGGSNNSIIKDTDLSNFTSYSIDASSDSINNTFINCTYNSSSEKITPDSQILREWYFDLVVNDSNGYLSGANVTIYNSTGSIIYSALTNSTGNVPRQELVEYVNNGTRYYKDPYNTTITKSDYTTNTTLYNLSQTTNVNSFVRLFGQGEISDCMAMTQSGYYNLTRNITTNGTCFTIYSNNVTLDFKGYSLIGNGSGYGVYTDSYSNITIKNGFIYNFLQGIHVCSGFKNITIINNTIENTNVNGIYIGSSINDKDSLVTENIIKNSYVAITSVLNNSIITRNTIINATTNGISIGGISNNITENIIKNFSGGAGFVIGSNYSLIKDNVIQTGISTGMFIYEGHYNNITNNSINRASSYAIEVKDGSSNNYIYNNSINNSYYAIYIAYSAGQNNLFELNILKNSTINVYITGDSNNSIIKDSDLSNFTLEPIFSNGNSKNSTFINCSYNTSKEDVEIGSQLFRKWYFDLVVNDSTGYLSGANVTVYNSTGSVIYSSLTNSTGNIDRQVLTEYVNNGGIRTYISPYNVTITKSGYTTNTTTYNLSVSTNVNHIVILQSISQPPKGNGGNGGGGGGGGTLNQSNLTTGNENQTNESQTTENGLSGGGKKTSTTNESCNSSWICSDWELCKGGSQTRICYDSNNCNTSIISTSTKKPVETQQCGTLNSVFSYETVKKLFNLVDVLLIVGILSIIYVLLRYYLMKRARQEKLENLQEERLKKSLGEKSIKEDQGKNDVKTNIEPDTNMEEKDNSN